ncbi:hypothetical protein FRC06_010346, partial [Ceratobasidium sp. 370]
WEQVDNARVLFALVGIISVHSDRSEDFKDEPTISLDGSSNFERFDIYAPFVKHLDVYGKRRKHFKLSEWHTLFRRARKGPLLPNLVSLTLNATDFYFAVDQMLWISAFASPSLLRFTPIHVRHSEMSLISSLAASIILKTLNERSPHIQSLGLYPQREIGPGQADGESCLLNMMWPGPFLPYLQSLSNLRSLSTSLWTIVGDGLLVLGGLPQLGNLVIRGCSDYLLEGHFSIPEDSFPQLTDLTLWEIHARMVAEFMGIKPLVNNLTNLSICPAFETEEQATWFEESTPFLLYTPRLKSFYYEVTYDLPLLPVHVRRNYISRRFLQHTSNIQLGSISLVGMEFAAIEALESMPAFWATLTSLCVVHGHLRPEELQYFARLPSLRSLTLRFRLRRSVDWPVFSGNETGLALRTLTTAAREIEFDPGVDARMIARSLLSLWPNLHSVRWPTVEDSNSRGFASSSQRFLGALNAWIAHSGAEEDVETA